MTRKELEDRLIDFSVLIIHIVSKLKKVKASVVLENQILRSGTSCSLNYGEANGSESNKDFIHKIQIVLKELRDTYIALQIIKKANLCIDHALLDRGLDENNQLISIFVKSVYTTKSYEKIDRK